MEKENFLPYAGTEERYEKWEQPIKVVNVLEQMNLHPRQHIEGGELSPEQSVDVDTRALQNSECVSVVYGRPHAGEYVPEDLWQRSSEEGRQTLAAVDRGTTEIFKSERIPSVGTKMSRFIVDPNRAPQLDQKSDNPMAPGKVLWYQGMFNGRMYKPGEEPSPEEVSELVERFYLPYYNKVMATLGSLTDRRKKSDERVLMLDGHSFPTSKNFDVLADHYGIKDMRELPMFIVGDSDGKTCDPDIRDAFVAALQRGFDALDSEIQAQLKKNVGGEIVAVNKFMKGVHNVKFYGQRQEGVSALQLECNESAYVDEIERDYYRYSFDNVRIQAMQKLIESACIDIDRILKKV